MYFIATLDKNRTRCVGYFKTFKEAEEAVINNAGDMNEDGYYKYAVIENIPEGVYRLDLSPVWYEWDETTKKYKKIKKCPKEFAHLVGFSIG